MLVISQFTNCTKTSAYFLKIELFKNQNVTLKMGEYCTKESRHYFITFDHNQNVYIWRIWITAIKWVTFLKRITTTTHLGIGINLYNLHSL